MGPMPEVLCRLSVFLQVLSCIGTSLIVFSVVSTRFAFAFVFKRIPVMDDDFWAKVINMSVLLWSTLATTAKYYVEERTMIVEVTFSED